jgi:hypothetical protein
VPGPCKIRKIRGADGEGASVAVIVEACSAGRGGRPWQQLGLLRCELTAVRNGTDTRVAMSTAQLQLAQTLTAQGWVLVENVLTESEVSDAAARIVGLLPQGGSPNDAYGKMEHEEGRQHELNGRLPLDASVCDPAVANLACLPAVVDVAAATLGIPQPKLRLNQTSVAVATYVSEPGGERVDENYEGFHVDWPQEVKRLVDRDDPTTMAEALASGSAALSGVLCCSTVEPRGGAFMVRSGSHAVIERHLRSGDRTMLERLLAQDMTVVESELGTRGGHLCVLALQLESYSTVPDYYLT